MVRRQRDLVHSGVNNDALLWQASRES
jgi:hypothetical protein